MSADVHHRNGDVLTLVTLASCRHFYVGMPLVLDNTTTRGPRRSRLWAWATKWMRRRWVVTAIDFACGTVTVAEERRWWRRFAP